MNWYSNIKNIDSGAIATWEDKGTTVGFNVQVYSPDFNLKYYLRSASAGAYTIQGTAHNTGWRFEIPAADTANFTEGKWFFDAIAIKATDATKIYKLGETGTFTVNQTLIYTGTAGKIDPRTPDQIERDNIQAALSKFNDGAASYSIGNRTFTRVDMSKLRERLHDLIPICLRQEKEQMLSQGKGSPFRIRSTFQN